jgi:hypothetical protein
MRGRVQALRKKVKAEGSKDKFNFMYQNLRSEKLSKITNSIYLSLLSVLPDQIVS